LQETEHFCRRSQQQVAKIVQCGDGSFTAAQAASAAVATLLNEGAIDSAGLVDRVLAIYVSLTKTSSGADESYTELTELQDTRRFYDDDLHAHLEPGGRVSEVRRTRLEPLARLISLGGNLVIGMNMASRQ
jgi:hypothetical protein